jgi:hypothetical protein
MDITKFGFGVYAKRLDFGVIFIRISATGHLLYINRLLESEWFMACIV